MYSLVIVQRFLEVLDNSLSFLVELVGFFVVMER